MENRFLAKNVEQGLNYLAPWEAVGNDHRRYGTAQNLKRLKEALDPLRKRLEDSDEAKAVREAVKALSEKKAAETEAAPDEPVQLRPKKAQAAAKTKAPAPAGIPQSQIDPELLKALQKRSDELGEEEIEFIPYRYKESKLGIADLSHFPVGDEEQRTYIENGLHKQFHWFLAEFDALIEDVE